MEKTGFTFPEIEYVLSLGERISLKKGTIFSQPNKCWEHLGILESGILGGWKPNENFDKKFMQFFYSPSHYLIVDYECFVEDKPAIQTIEVLEDATILFYSRKHYFEVKDKLSKFLDLEKRTAERKFLESQKLVTMFQNCDAIERIKLIQESSPEIMTKVPYSYIASFLGLHRNTFAQAIKKL
ncbi:Crp/Fnr family transcriptional regulator [Chryseobacterium sp. IT-36CA2]|uniref:Crp/Fnr family transcriptional regulator n=1 Tax=Chryseobacterium sp. IT-36CA2 TaxID=3026460 RepID=UPI0039E09C97